MNKISKILAAFFFVLSALQTASGHIGYTNRNFGTWSETGGIWSVTGNSGNFSNSLVAITATNIPSSYGWADATDSDFGDSHKGRWFRFTLASSATVTLALTGGGQSSISYVSGTRLLPAYSIYSGLAHLSPDAASHDGAQITIDYLNQTYPNGFGGTTKTDGAFNALGNFAIGNDSGSTPASLRYFSYIGHVADGTSANYGSAAGINGDGNADGYVTGTFNLAAGDYSVFIGGSDYFSQTDVQNYGLTATFGVVPEPSTYALVGFIVALFALVNLRRKKS